MTSVTSQKSFSKNGAYRYFTYLRMAGNRTRSSFRCL
nr:MAG TPA: hypothetical protein [Caudoviricetes sp.]